MSESITDWPVEEIQVEVDVTDEPPPVLSPDKQDDDLVIGDWESEGGAAF